MNNPVKVMFLCTGNMCRSPIAEVLFKSMLEEEGLAGRFEVASAGTHGHYNAGGGAAPLAVAVAQERQLDLTEHRVRQVRGIDLEEFDYILAMDENNIGSLRLSYPPELVNKVVIITEYAPELGLPAIQDPFMGPEAEYREAFDALEKAVRGFLEYVKAQEQLTSS